MFCKLKMILRREKGASAVEFAILLPVLIAILLGIIEFGFLFFEDLCITHAAREGARLAAVGNFDEAVVEKRAFLADSEDGSKLTVSIDPPGGSGSIGDAVTVTVSFKYETLTGFFDSILEGTLGDTLASSATMRLEKNIP